MGQPFSIVRRTRGGTPFFQVTDHRTHKDYRAATKREATAIAKRIERGEDPNGEGREPGVTREQARRHPVATYVVEIVEHATGEVVHRSANPMTERQADRADEGFNINLDHEHFFTRVVEA